MDIYKLAFEKMDAPSYLLDANGQLSDCNRLLLDFLGVAAQNENSIYNMFHRHGLWTRQQIQNFQQDDMGAIVSGIKSKKEQSVIHESGDVLYFEFVRIPLFDESGNAFGLMVTIYNVTKQKLMGTKLKEKEERLNYVNKLIDHSDKSVAKDINVTRVMKVLIVEDNLITQKVEKKLLLSLHCLTDVVETVAQVSEIFKPGKYDLALVDLGLGSGNGNGYQATCILREMEHGSSFRVPIIALTGAELNSVEYECDDSEMDGIISKPLTYEQAKQLIRRYVLHANVTVPGLKAFRH